MMRKNDKEDITNSDLCLCACGCGRYRPTKDRDGNIRKFISGHHSSGKKGPISPHWKGGKYKDKQGYARIITPQNYHTPTKQGHIREHRLIYEEYYKCCLLKWADIHHINGIKTDNRIENMMPLSRSKHMIISHTKKKIP